MIFLESSKEQVGKFLAKDYIMYAHGHGHQASFILILPCFHYWWTASLSTPLGHLNDENPARQCANCTKSIQWSKKSKTHSIAQCNWMCFWFFASLNAFSGVLHSTQMDNRNFPWHLGFENKFYARITNSGEMCVGFRLFPATVFLVEYFWVRFKKIPFWVKRAIVKNFMILLFLFSLYFWINALFHIASTFDLLGSSSRTAKKSFSAILHTHLERNMING